MAPTSKPAAAADGRRKSSGAGKPSLVIKLSVPPSNLRDLMDKSDQGSATPAPQADDDVDVKQRTPDSASTTQPAAHDANNASDSNAATPQADNGTPAPAAMGPPADGPKKKGVKRANGAGGDSTPKARGKPGPKKKPRLEDGTIDPSGSRLSGMHKLGPKANLGAINAGLRALDRSGKPCRRWTKGGFTLKTFTGVVWGVPRWTAPPKPSTADVDPDASAVPSAADSSSKENKDAADGAKQVNGNNAADTTVADVTVADADATMADTTVADATLADATVADATIAEDSNNGDVEMQSAADSVPASSPAPVAVSAAS